MRYSGVVLLVTVAVIAATRTAVQTGHAEFRLPLLSAAPAAAMLGVARTLWKRGGGSDFGEGGS